MIFPTLQIISGPMAGRLFTLDRELTIIGRSPECEVVLSPKSVSRKHAAVLRQNERFLIKDMGSKRGTFVNGERLQNAIELDDDATIQTGDVLLQFRRGVLQVQDDNDEQSTVYAAIDLLNQSDQIVPLVRPETKLRALQLISRELGGTLLLGEMLDRIFNSLFEIFPTAERGFVLMYDAANDTMVPELVRSRAKRSGELTVSKAVLDRVLKKGEAILSKDLGQEFPNSESATSSRIRSLMCVPLFDQARKPVGAVQIDTRDSKGRFVQDDLDLLVAVASQISVAVQNARLHKAMVRQRELDQELQFAREVMNALLPERPTSVPGYEFWAHYEPARHVGGDYYGFLPLGPTAVEPQRAEGPERWAIAVGDVVGKGMPAALLTARLSAEVRLVLQGPGDPARIVGKLNHPLDDGGVLDLYITFLLLILDARRHRLQLVNAGHPCPLVRRRDGALEEWGRSIAGLPLAIMPDQDYQVSEIALEPGESVLLYTDGVTDAMNSANERFGEERLRHAIAQAPPDASAEALGTAIIAAVRQFVADRAQFDDITLVCLARKAPGPHAGL